MIEHDASRHANLVYNSFLPILLHIHVHIVAVHSQDSMRLACAKAVLAVHCNYFVGSS